MLGVSPAFIGGCGLKLAAAALMMGIVVGFARLYWRVRIETPFNPATGKCEASFARLYWRVRIETF